MVKIVIKKRVVTLDDSDYEQLENEFGPNVNLELTLSRGQQPHVITRVTVSKGKREVISVGRFLVGIQHDPKLVVIFSDKNPLNLSRNNMSVGTRAEMMKGRSAAKNSSSKYLGVYWSKPHKKWRVAIKPSKERKTFHVGLYDNEEDAALAYNEVAIKYHGRFANLNIVKQIEAIDKHS